MFRYAIHNKRYPVSQPKCIISPYKQKFKKKKKNIQRTSLVLKISRKILVKYLRKKQTKIQFSKNVKVVLNLTINTAFKTQTSESPSYQSITYYIVYLYMFTCIISRKISNLKKRLEQERNW